MSAAPTTTPPYTGEFLFVNQDASTPINTTHRHAVFTHVQRTYRRFRRQQQARQLGASAKIPKQPPAGDSLTCIGSPTTLLGKGNSDPFNAFSVAVDPELNALMCFDRDVLHPKWHSVVQLYAPSIERSLSDWSSIVVSMYSTATAFGYLARTAIVLASVSPDPTYARTALVYRARASRQLRSDLAQTDTSLCNEKLHRSIGALLEAELFAQNYTAATYHTKMLDSLFTLQERPNLDHSNVYNVVRNDVQRAAMSLTHSIFDMSATGWAARYLSSNVLALTSTIPRISELATQGLDPSVQHNPALLPLFISARSLLLIPRSILTDPSLSTHTNWVTFASQFGIFLQGRFINHYVDVTNQQKPNNTHPDADPPNQPTTTSSSTYTTHVQAYTSLAATHWIRAIGNIDHFRISPHSPPIYNATPTILSALRAALEQAAPAESAANANLRLWTLHVAAQAEQAEGLDGWFTAALAHQLRSMRTVTNWVECRAVLLGFLYSDTVQPHGSAWFWKVMREEGAGEEEEQEEVEEPAAE